MLTVLSVISTRPVLGERRARLCEAWRAGGAFAGDAREGCLLVTTGRRT